MFNRKSISWDGASAREIDTYKEPTLKKNITRNICSRKYLLDLVSTGDRNNLTILLEGVAMSPWSIYAPQNTC